VVEDALGRNISTIATDDRGVRSGEVNAKGRACRVISAAASPGGAPWWHHDLEISAPYDLPPQHTMPTDKSFTPRLRPSLLLFDVFGTLVDWRTSVARAVRHELAALGLAEGAQAEAFADAWRGRYQPSMQEVRSGRLPFSKLDVLHRHNLDHVLKAWGLDAQVGEAQRQRLTRAWHQLDGWPDVAAGLAELRTLCLLAPCSNGNLSLMAHLARHNGWHWDAIVGAEWARDYKPQPVVYTAAVDAFGVEPGQAMMVAAHSSDLAAAAACGLQTAFIARPDEHGPGTGEPRATVPVDVSCPSLTALAQALRG
jgi:2-haloacid dehalogenase